jgi:membrane protein YdbS with pleckstrin-like domain
MPNFIQSFLSQDGARGARSTALHALQWMMGILLAALAPMAFSKVPTWIMALDAVCAVSVLAVFLVSYVYLLIHDPDALRSETYSLYKIAIQKGIFGDSLTGIARPEEIDGSSLTVQALSSKQETE